MTNSFKTLHAALTFGLLYFGTLFAQTDEQQNEDFQ